MSSSSSDSTRNRSNSADDPELPTHDRKRPRLSTGGSDIHTSSQPSSPSVPEMPTPSLPSDSSTAASHHLASQKPALPPRPSAVPNVTTPSKVTINTRPLSAQSARRDEEALTNEPPIDPALMQPNTEHHAVLDLNGHKTSSEQDEAERSPSPPIEIAEPDDIDGDPAYTRWTTRIGGSAYFTQPVAISIDHVNRTFPGASDHVLGDSFKAINAIVRAFERNENVLGAFRRAKTWLVEFVNICDDLTQEVIDAELQFWWMLPHIVTTLFRCNAQMLSNFETSDIGDFFIAYGKLTKLIMAQDLSHLRAMDPKTSTTIRHVFSGQYFLPYSIIIDESREKNPSPFTFLSYARRLEGEGLVLLEDITRALLASGEVDLLQDFPQFVAALAEVLPLFPKLAHAFLSVVDAAILATQSFTDVIASTHYSAFSDFEEQKVEVMYVIERVVLTINTTLYTTVKKQHSWLNLEIAQQLVRKMTIIMRRLPVELPRLGQSIIETASMTVEEADLTYLDHTMPLAWRLWIYWTFMKFGRMELRVGGVTAMGDDLVSVFEERIKDKSVDRVRRDPLVNYVVRFLRANDVVKYVIGVDSHPQLAGRSGRLVGFFGVSGAYENVDTDIMWQTILGTHDPRIATEALLTLESSLTAVKVEHLNHICQKMIELPFERWNDDFLRFGCKLLDQLDGQSRRSAHPPVAPVVRELLLHVLKTCLRPGRCFEDISQKLVADWVPRLQLYFQVSKEHAGHFAIARAEEENVFSVIRDEISSNSENSGGAILALHEILAKTGNVGVAGKVAEMCNLPGALIQNIVFMVKTSSTSPEFCLQMDCRIKLLGYLILSVPDKFTSDSFDLFWSCVLANQEIKPSARHLAWDHLTYAMQQCGKHQNTVIKSILQDYWPRLHSQVVDLPILHFAQRALEYDCQFSSPVDVVSNGIFCIPGEHRVKELMLKAHSDQVGSEAASFLINQFLRHPSIKKQTKAVIKSTHMALMDEAVSIALGAAARLQSVVANSGSSEDVMDVMIATPEEIHAEELRFDRSLLFLKRFTEAVRSRPGDSPLMNELPDFQGRQGQPRDLMVEVGSSKYVASGSRKVTVGIQNTGAELWQYLASITGFSTFKVICSGYTISLQHEERTIADLNVVGKVQVQKCEDTVEAGPTRRLRSTSPIENKIMLHSDDLYNLLEADQRLAKSVYQFLRTTSVRKELEDRFRQMNQPASEILPCDKLYKLLFNAEALRSLVEEEALSADPDTNLLVFASQALCTALSDLATSGFEHSLAFSASEELMSILSLSLRAKMIKDDTTAAVIQDPAVFVTSTLAFLIQVSHVVTSDPSDPHIRALRAGLEALIEGALHDSRVREAFTSDARFETVLKQTIFDPNERVRKSLFDVLKELSGETDEKGQFLYLDRIARDRHESESIRDVLLHLWRYIPAMITEAASHSAHCQHFLKLAVAIFKRLGSALDQSTVAQVYLTCQQVLFAHKHVQSVGKASVDGLLAGIAPLLNACVSFLNAQKALPDPAVLVERICDRFLFPPMSESGAEISLPVIDSGTRAVLYDLCLLLCQSQQEVVLMLERMSDNIHDESPEEIWTSRERLNLRSEVGYAGLTNLSNTCYLNSLFSQLFMNVGFRDFLCSTAARAPNPSLVRELAVVFAHMQDSYQKSVNPSTAVECIVTYDGAKIDPSIQMDVDEFFNLLFDRIETELSDPEQKTAFKAFYGGQVIQQIKSAECSHVSERPEPFSVVPIEIKGKTSLEESLRAYVEGEMLQGDNKYSCTACGRHVDAVKRSCFKQIPDNLIFNLKRFDFDIITATRAKLNDRFEFPETIDMAPYTLDSIMNREPEGSKDIFQLTGVIVHSGTAEIGHYYSFIRDKTSNESSGDSWVQFNDSDVSYFEPNSIGDNCFGGAETMYNMMKPYNGYMLFYQRQSYKEHLAVTMNGVSPRPAAIAGLENHIKQLNELYVRSYVVQDPKHAEFVHNLLQTLDRLCDKKCSDDHELESSILRMALRYMVGFSMQWKELPSVKETMRELQARCDRCQRCADTLLDCLTVEPQRMLTHVIASPYSVVRQHSSSTILTALTKLKCNATEPLSAADIYDHYLLRVPQGLSKSWPSVMLHRSSWPEYFSLLVEVAQLGIAYLIAILEAGLLQRILEVIQVHNADNIDSDLHTRYWDYLCTRDKRRDQHHDMLVKTLYLLLERVNLDIMPGAKGQRRCSVEVEAVGLSAMERRKLGLDNCDPRWVCGPAKTQSAPQYLDKLIAKFAAEQQSCFRLGTRIAESLREERIADAASFIRPALIFLAHCYEERALYHVAGLFAEAVETIELSYGLEFTDLIKGMSTTSNVSLQQPSGFLLGVLRDKILSWAPMLLYGRNEQGRNIREEALELIEDIADLPVLNEAETSPNERRIRLRRARDLMQQIAKVGKDHFLNHGTLNNAGLQRDHFKFAIEAFSRCYKYASQKTHSTGTQSGIEVTEWWNIMKALHARTVRVVESVDENEFDDSSDIDGMSDGLYDTDGGGI